MNTQRKALSIFGIGIAVLAAGIAGAGQPVTAAGLTRPMQIGRQAVVQDFNSDRYGDDRRRDVRREQEFRREQDRLAREQAIRREEHRREFREDRRGGYRAESRDWHRDHFDRQGDSLQIIVR